MSSDGHQPLYLQEPLMMRAAFPRRPEDVKAARDWARSTFRYLGGPADIAETCALIVSELVTNAVRHTNGLQVEVTLWGTHHIDVRDNSSARPAVRAASDCDETGRGLILVETLAERFEVIPDEDGKINRVHLACGSRTASKTVRRAGRRPDPVVAECFIRSGQPGDTQ